MAGRGFPVSPCDVCGQPFGDVKEGIVAADNFHPMLQKAYTKHEQMNANLVNTVTIEYFLQFPERFRQYSSDAVCVAAPLMDMHIDMNAHEYRLEKVVKNCPSQFVLLTVHDACAPELLSYSYCFPLEEINSPEKALDWTFHLNEKKWLNLRGWIHVLEKLFGRRNV